MPAGVGVHAQPDCGGTVEELDLVLQHAADAIDAACSVARPHPYGPVRAALADAQIRVHDACRQHALERRVERVVDSPVMH